MNIFESKKEIRDHLLELTKELVTYRSHCGEPLKIFELSKFIQNYFAKDSCHVKAHVINGVPALVITTEETKHPHILLSGHIDVVASSSQFMPRTEKDFLYGSGTMDMKGGIACMMAVLKYFCHQKNRPSLGLMLTSDEEIGGESTKILLEQEGYGTDFCIVNEGRSKYEIVIREKGLFVIKLRLKGESLHSAYPWKSLNVLQELMKGCVELQKKFPKPRDRWVPTMSVTYLHGAGDLNTIPGEAEALLSYRLIEKKWNREKIIELVKKYIPEVQIEEIVYGEAFEVDPKHPHVQLLREVAQKVTGKRIPFASNHGASDARFFVKKDIPTAILGPVGDRHHTPEEYVVIESLAIHFEVLREFVAREQSGL